MASGIGGAIGGFKKIRRGKQLERAGQAGIDNFEWEDLTNPYDNLQISTAGAEMRTDQANITTSNMVEAMRAGGTRGLANLGRVQAQNNMVSRDIAADLDQQQKNIDMKAAQDDTRIRDMVEKRQSDELAGYGNMMDVGMDMQQSGMGDLVAVGGAIDSLAYAGMTGAFGGGSGSGS